MNALANPLYVALLLAGSLIAVVLILGRLFGKNQFQQMMRDEENRRSLAEIQKTIERLNDIDIKLIAQSLEGRGYAVVPIDEVSYARETAPSGRSPLFLVIGLLAVVISAIVNRPQ